MNFDDSFQPPKFGLIGWMILFFSYMTVINDQVLDPYYPASDRDDRVPDGMDMHLINL